MCGKCHYGYHHGTPEVKAKMRKKVKAWLKKHEKARAKTT